MGEEGDVVQVGSETGDGTGLITVDFNDGRIVRIPFRRLDVVSDDSDDDSDESEDDGENAAPVAEESENPTWGHTYGKAGRFEHFGEILQT